MSHFSRDNMQRFFAPWEQLQQEILAFEDDKSEEAREKMERALQNYYDLLNYGEVEENEESLLFPLNGKERLAFIEKHMPGRYSFIQLDALYDESRKKAARLSVTYRNA